MPTKREALLEQTRTQLWERIPEGSWDRGKPYDEPKIIGNIDGVSVWECTVQYHVQDEYGVAPTTVLTDPVPGLVGFLFGVSADGNVLWVTSVGYPDLIEIIIERGKLLVRDRYGPRPQTLTLDPRTGEQK